MDVVSVVEELLKEFYGELAEFQREDATNSRKEKVKEKLSVQDEDFDILLARRKDPVQNKDRAQEMALNLPTPPPPPEEEPDDIGLEPLDEAAIGTLLFLHLYETILTDNVEAEKEQIRKDSRLSNPWTITMMNTPSSPKHRRTAALDSSSPIRPPADTNPSSRPPITTLNITIPSPSRPSFTPVNPLHSCTDGGNSAPFPRTPALKPPRRGFGIPPTPFSPPRSVERQQQRTLLEDPDNAGAMDRFVVRTRRSPEPNRRPIPREFEGRPVDPAQIRRAPEREPTPEPIAPRGVEPMRGLESTGTLGPSRGFETIRGLELRGELEPRGGLEPIPKLIPPRGGPPSVEATNTRRTRPRGEEPFNTPRGGFLTAAQVYDEVGSQQFELNDDRDDNHPHKRRRVHANNSPHRNRFLSATAELHDDRPPAESPRSLRPLPPSPLGPPVPPEDESPRRPRPLPPSLLGPPNSKPPLLVPEVGPPNPPPKPGARPTTSHRRRHTTRALPVPPLFPLDPEWQTHQLVTTMSTLNLEVVPAEDPETLDGGAEFDKDVIGDVVARWLEKLTGVKENVKGWELVEGEEGGRVLKAIHNGEGEGVEVGGK